MTPVPRPESKHVYSTLHRKRPYYIHTPNLAAHLATLGFEVELVPSKQPGRWSWRVSADARAAADKYIVTLKLLLEEREARMAAAREMQARAEGDTR